MDITHHLQNLLKTRMYVSQTFGGCTKDECKVRSEIGAGFDMVNINNQTAWINYSNNSQRRFINYTHDALKGLAEQLSATSQMARQNRKALDRLLAENGGVCEMFGDICCTFIPNFTSSDGSVTQVLEGLQNLRKKLRVNSGVCVESH